MKPVYSQDVNLINTMHADVLAPDGARTSAAIVITTKLNIFPTDFLNPYPWFWNHICWPGPRFIIKIPSYQYRKSHCGDKTILRPSYLHNGISYSGKMISLYWIRAQIVSLKMADRVSQNKAELAHWGRDKMDAVLQMTFFNCIFLNEYWYIFI